MCSCSRPLAALAVRASHASHNIYMTHLHGSIVDKDVDASKCCHSLVHHLPAQTASRSQQPSISTSNTSLACKFESQAAQLV